MLIHFLNFPKNSGWRLMRGWQSWINFGIAHAANLWTNTRAHWMCWQGTYIKDIIMIKIWLDTTTSCAQWKRNCQSLPHKIQSASSGRMPLTKVHCSFRVLHWVCENTMICKIDIHLQLWMIVLSKEPVCYSIVVRWCQPLQQASRSTPMRSWRQWQNYFSSQQESFPNLRIPSSDL